MVNSTAFDTNASIGQEDRNAVKICTQPNENNPVYTASSRSSPRLKNPSPDGELPLKAQAPARTEPEGKRVTENAVTGDNIDDEDNTLCCSVPLEKVQGVLTTIHHPKCDEPKPTRKLLCLYCERSFASANLRLKHVERVHSVKKNRRLSSRKQQLSITPCIYCDKTDSSENALRELFRHLVDEHSDKYFGCALCEERFLTSALLGDHHAAVHPAVEVPKAARTDNEAATTVKLTRSRVKPKLDAEITVRSKNAKLKELRSKKLTVTSSRIAFNRRESKRLQALAKLTEAQKKKRQKPADRKQTNVHKPEALNDKASKPASICVNPYPEFDHFYRVKKITDHSIDNLKISSLTFDDVFDKAFFNRIKCNIEENLLHHIDGKLFENEASESRISNFEKVSSAQPDIPNSTADNFGCELSLNAVTPVAALSLNSQFGEDFESQIEYGAKPSKKKTQTKKDEVHYKYFTRRKFQASILEHKENRDLSKLDMWTQLVIKKRQQKIIDDKKTAKEILEYSACDEYKNKLKKEELNRILDRRGPFEDLREEASKKAALDKLNSVSEDSISHESFTEVRAVLNEILSRVFAVTEEPEEVVEKATNIIRASSKPDLREIPGFLDLRRSSSLHADDEIDQSDKITLICSSQDTENFELPTNVARGKNELVEMSGEWARCRLYICAACGAKLPNMKYLLEHKTIYHQNVWVQHYEFVGNQSELYRHLSIPALGKVGFVEDNAACKMWRRSEARACSKCDKQCNTLGELHRHILECGGDWTWVLVRKKCKYRYGAKSRRKRRGTVLKVHRTKRKTDSTEKKKYTYNGPRQRPSDAETIQRMLADLPAKRSTRKLISLYDGVRRKQKSKELDNVKQKKVKCGKVIYDRSSNIKETTEKTINTVVPRKKSQLNNKSSNVRALRSLGRVLSSRILDTSAKLTVKRKLKAFNERRRTRQSIIAETDKDNDEVAETRTMKINVSKDTTPKRTSPRSANIVRTLKLFAGNANIKSFFPVKKRKVKKEAEPKDVKTRSKKKPNEPDDVVKTVEDGTKTKSALVRSLSANKKKKDAPADEKVESKEELELTRRKRKLKQSFRNVINRVKRLKIDATPTIDAAQTPIKDEPQPVTNGPFLDERQRDDAKIVIPSNVEAKENIADISETARTVIAFNGNDEDPPVPENIFKLDAGNEKHLQAKGATDFDTSEDDAAVKTENEAKLEPISIETSVKAKSVPMISPNVKGKIRKPARGLNDCIAMLTSKLRQKTEPLPKPCSSNVLPSTQQPKIVTDPSPQTAECILKIPSFKTQNAEDVALDLSIKSRHKERERLVPFMMFDKDSLWDLTRLTSVERIIENVVSNKFQEPQKLQLTLPSSNSIDRTIQNVIDGHLKQKNIRTTVDDIIDYVIDFGPPIGFDKPVTDLKSPLLLGTEETATEAKDAVPEFDTVKILSTKEKVMKVVGKIVQFGKSKKQIEERTVKPSIETPVDRTLDNTVPISQENLKSAINIEDEPNVMENKTVIRDISLPILVKPVELNLNDTNEDNVNKETANGDDKSRNKSNQNLRSFRKQNKVSKTAPVDTRQDNSNSFVEETAPEAKDDENNLVPKKLPIRAKKNAQKTKDFQTAEEEPSVLNTEEVSDENNKEALEIAPVDAGASLIISFKTKRKKKSIKKFTKKKTKKSAKSLPGITENDNTDKSDQIEIVAVKESAIEDQSNAETVETQLIKTKSISNIIKPAVLSITSILKRDVPKEDIQPLDVESILPTFELKPQVHLIPHLIESDKKFKKPIGGKAKKKICKAKKSTMLKRNTFKFLPLTGIGETESITNSAEARFGEKQPVEDFAAKENIQQSDDSKSLNVPEEEKVDQRLKKFVKKCKKSTTDGITVVDQERSVIDDTAKENMEQSDDGKSENVPEVEKVDQSLKKCKKSSTDGIAVVDQERSVEIVTDDTAKENMEQSDDSKPSNVPEVENAEIRPKKPKKSSKRGRPPKANKILTSRTDVNSEVTEDINTNLLKIELRSLETQQESTSFQTDVESEQRTEEKRKMPNRKSKLKKPSDPVGEEVIKKHSQPISDNPAETTLNASNESLDDPTASEASNSATDLQKTRSRRTTRSLENLNRDFAPTVELEQTHRLTRTTRSLENLTKSVEEGTEGEELDEDSEMAKSKIRNRKSPKSLKSVEESPTGHTESAEIADSEDKIEVPTRTRGRKPSIRNKEERRSNAEEVLPTDVPQESIGRPKRSKPSKSEITGVEIDAERKTERPKSAITLRPTDKSKFKRRIKSAKKFIKSASLENLNDFGSVAATNKLEQAVGTSNSQLNEIESTIEIPKIEDQKLTVKRKLRVTKAKIVADKQEDEEESVFEDEIRHAPKKFERKKSPKKQIGISADREEEEEDSVFEDEIRQVRERSVKKKTEEIETEEESVFEDEMKKSDRNSENHVVPEGEVDVAVVEEDAVPKKRSNKNRTVQEVTAHEEEESIFEDEIMNVSKTDKDIAEDVQLEEESVFEDVPKRNAKKKTIKEDSSGGLRKTRSSTNLTSSDESLTKLNDSLDAEVSKIMGFSEFITPDRKICNTSTFMNSSQSDGSPYKFKRANRRSSKHSILFRSEECLNATNSENATPADVSPIATVSKGSEEFLSVAGTDNFENSTPIPFPGTSPSKIPESHNSPVKTKRANKKAKKLVATSVLTRTEESLNDSENANPAEPADGFQSQKAARPLRRSAKCLTIQKEITPVEEDAGRISRNDEISPVDDGDNIKLLEEKIRNAIRRSLMSMSDAEDEDKTNSKINHSETPVKEIDDGEDFSRQQIDAVDGFKEIEDLSRQIDVVDDLEVKEDQQTIKRPKRSRKVNLDDKRVAENASKIDNTSSEIETSTSRSLRRKSAVNYAEIEESKEVTEDPPNPENKDVVRATNNDEINDSVPDDSGNETANDTVDDKNIQDSDLKSKEDAYVLKENLTKNTLLETDPMNKKRAKLRAGKGKKRLIRNRKTDIPEIDSTELPSVISENIISVTDVESAVDKEIVIEKEPPIKIIINKHKARRKSKSIKKAGLKGHNDLYEDFALVIKKKRRAPFITFSPPDTFSKEDTYPMQVHVPETPPDKDLDESVEEMDMELDEIPIKTNIIETPNLLTNAENESKSEIIVVKKKKGKSRVNRKKSTVAAKIDVPDTEMPVVKSNDVQICDYFAEVVNGKAPDDEAPTNNFVLDKDDFSSDDFEIDNSFEDSIISEENNAPKQPSVDAETLFNKLIENTEFVKPLILKKTKVFKKKSGKKSKNRHLDTADDETSESELETDEALIKTSEDDTTDNSIAADAAFEVVDADAKEQSVKDVYAEDSLDFLKPALKSTKKSRKKGDKRKSKPRNAPHEPQSQNFDDSNKDSEALTEEISQIEDKLPVNFEESTLSVKKWYAKTDELAKDIDKLYAFSETEDFELDKPIELPRRLPRKTDLDKQSDFKEETATKEPAPSKKPARRKSKIGNVEDAPDLNFSGVFGEAKPAEESTMLPENETELDGRKSLRSAKVKALEIIHDEALAEYTDNETIKDKKPAKINDVDKKCNKRNKKPNNFDNLFPNSQLVDPETIVDAAKANSGKKPNKKQKKNEKLLETFNFPKEVFDGEAPLLEDLVAELDGLEELENSIERELNAEITEEKKSKDARPETNNKCTEEGLTADENQELRRSRRGSRKVASYNENDLIDPLVDAMESKRNKKRDDKAKKEAEKKLNSEELFDLLKASTVDNSYVPKQQNAFLTSLEDASREVTDDNFDNVFENMLEKSAMLASQQKGDVDKMYEFSDNVDEPKAKKSKKIEDVEQISVSQDSTSDSKSKSDNFCEICNKCFVKLENLIKHRRTLTHIQKLSELEAKEAEKSKIISRHEDENSRESAIEPPYLPEFDNSDLKIGDILTNKDDIRSPFNANRSLKLADIISDVLNKPVLSCLDEEPNKFSDIILQNDTKRYKSLGERKSFDSETQMTEPTETILEKQISLLENIIENQTANNYIDDISLSSEKTDIPTEPGSPIASAPITVDSFAKPIQYEEISEDSANLRTYDDPKLRKTLNRDEELFLECCSLLKSGSEVSSGYSSKKAHEKKLRTLNLKSVDAPKVNEYSDDSRIPTPLGNSYDDDASDSNTISSSWGADEKGFGFERVDNDSGDGFDDVLPTNRTEEKVASHRSSTDEVGDGSDNRKVMTKGARKVFEGLKVSIPTEELNMDEVLNNSPKQKKPETEKTNEDDEKLHSPTSKRKSKPVKNAQVGSNLLFKVSKKKLVNDKGYDVYDFEETQDNTDAFAKPNYRAFRTQKVGEESESEDFAEPEPPVIVATPMVKKSKAQENITKKKCMIMGRIFKNAAKSKMEDIDDEIGTVPVIDNEELVENYVAECIEAEAIEDVDCVPEEPSERNQKQTKPAKIDAKRLEMKKKAKHKGKKRIRTNSDSTDDEFSIRKTNKRKTNRKNAKEEDNCINLEQELKECIGVASRKSQRKCTSGKQNVLVEYWSSDDSQFEALLENRTIPIKQIETKPPPEPEPVPPPPLEVKKPVLQKKRSSVGAPVVDNGNRRKRAAVNPLYHWSSSSEDESNDLIEVKPLREGLEDDEDRPVQHGWIVGDSPKKLVTMLAQAKGKKADIDSVKEQGKKRTNTVS